MYGFFLSIAMLGSPPDSQELQAQPVLVTTINDEKQYPVFSSIPTPSAYHLDATATKFLSNSSFKSILIGEEVQLSAWSTDVNGGFSYGTANTLGQFNPSGIEAIADAKDIQVGFLENVPLNKTYIVVSYYDVADTNYAYRLYDWNYALGTLNLLYTYTFFDPEYPNLPYTTRSTMQYNQIRMDISLRANKVAFTFSNAANHNMYAVVGKLDNDTILCSPFLPRFSGMVGASVIPITLIYPYNAVYDPLTWDPSVFTIDPSTGDLHWLYPDNPVIRILATPDVYTPPYTFTIIQQEWPDVAFSSPSEHPSTVDIENLTFTYYTYDLQNIYFSNESSFLDLYNYTGTGVDFTHNFMTPGRRSYDGSYLTYAPLPPTFMGIARLPGESVKYRLDCPDVDATERKWAIAYENNYSPSTTNDIYLRYGLSGTAFSNNVILTNGFLGNFNISAFNNIFPAVSYNQSGSRILVGWASNAINTVYPLNDYSYIGVELDGSSTTPTLISTSDYLLLCKKPDLDAGDHPVLAYSKHQHDMGYLYHSFADDDIAYSIKHRSHAWASSGMWKKTKVDAGIAGTQTKIALLPNPFSQQIQISAQQMDQHARVRIIDLMGRTLFYETGSLEELNKRLSQCSVKLVPGHYLLTLQDAEGQNSQFKIQKY